jgi:hypothetical protein
MRLAYAIAATLLAGTALADAPAPATDSIADAKKDLAEIKAAVPGQDLGTALQGADLRELGAIPGPLRADSPAPLPSEKDAGDALKKKQGTGNWLVDAMEKQEEHDHAGKAKDKDEQLKEDLALIRGEDRKSDKENLLLDEPKEREAPPREEAQKAFNPLDSFMSGWVAPRDREVLLAKSDASHPDALPGLEAPQAAAGPDLLLGGVSDPTAFSEPVGINPYVTALTPTESAPFHPLGPAELADFGSAALPEFSRGLSASGPEAKPGGEAKSFIPDFAQPSDDDKYFKQLKRF